MIPARFDYVAPPDPAACVAALAEGGRVLAGGTWVLPEMGRGESRPSQLVDLRHAGLNGIDVGASVVRLGAMCTYADLLASDVVERHLPLLRLMASGITGGWALRNQATIGGSAAAARPSSDIPAALTTCGASARVLGSAGERVVPVHELFAGALDSTLRAGEVLLGFDVPSWQDAGHGYVKLKRGASSWPIATAAALVRVDGAGDCTHVSLTLGGVSAVPVRVDLSGLLLGRPLDDEALRAAAAYAGEQVVEPWADVLAPADYRAAVAGPLARRALTMGRTHTRTEEELAHG